MLLSVVLWLVIAASLAAMFLRRMSAVQAFALGCMLVFAIQLLDLIAGDGGLTVVWGLRVDSFGLPDLPRLLSSMYLHGDLLHVLSNLIFLIFLGSALEERSGKTVAAMALLFGGLIGSFTHLLVNYGDHAILIGASGAVSGVMGAIICLHPNDETPMFLGPIFMFKVPVYLSVGFFLVLETALVFLDSSGNVAHDVHIAGFLAGVLLGALWPRPGEASSERTKGGGSKSSAAPCSELAVDSRSAEAVRNIRPDDPPEVRRVWLERLAEIARCARCGGKLEAGEESVRCEACGVRYCK